MKKLCTLITIAFLFTILFSSNVFSQNDSEIHLFEIEESESDHIETFVKVDPEYIPGDDKLKLFIEKKIKYPKEELKNDKEDRLFMQFEVKKDGSIGKIQITYGSNQKFIDETVRVIRMIPDEFKPAIRSDKIVNCWYPFNVEFKIDKEKSKGVIIFKKGWKK